MSEDYAGLVKRLREMADHGGAPSRLATMRAAADAIGTLERELNRANSQVAVAGHQVEEVVRETRLMKASVEAREWQPIVTAPEATYVMVFLPNAGMTVATMTRDGAVDHWWDGEERVYPTHWMPLPPSPGRATCRTA